MSINQLIMNFHSFLTVCWPNISDILEQLNWDESPYFLDDWIQANWELIVEQQILESGQFLMPYGYNRALGSRYTYKGAKFTHKLTCNKKGQIESQYDFLCFVSKVGGSFKIEPPFDLVEVEDFKTGDRLSLAFDEVEFSVEKIKKN